MLSQSLAFAGRNGPWLLLFGVLVGLVLPPLAEAAYPLMGMAVFIFTLGAFLKVELASTCENSRRVPTLRAVRAAQKGSKQTTQGDNVVVLAVGEIVPGVEQGLRGLLEGVRNVGTEVGATSPMLAASAVVASGGRLVSAAAATTVVASDLPTSCRWLAKAFEPAAVAAVSSAAGGTGCRPPHRSEPVCGRTKRHCGAVLVRAPRVGGVLRGALVSVTSYSALYGDRSKRIGVLPDNGAS